jgi:opacity protein-like surface antigen
MRLCAATALAASFALAGAAGAQEITLRGFGGLTFGGKADAFSRFESPLLIVTNEGTLDLDTGFVVGGAAGFKFGGLTLDGEVAYRDADFKIQDDPVAANVFGSEERATVLSVMANGWYDVPFSNDWVGYGGAGIGVAQGLVDTDGAELKGDFGLAWQFGLGLKRLVGEHMSLGMGYRYFSATDAVDDTLAGVGSTFSVNSDYTDNSVIAEIGFTF